MQTVLILVIFLNFMTVMTLRTDVNVNASFEREGIDPDYVGYFNTTEAKFAISAMTWGRPDDNFYDIFVPRAYFYEWGDEAVR